MKVSGPSAPTSAGSARPTRSASGFSLGATSGSAPASATTAAASTSSVADVSALMALQGVEGPLERRRRAIRRGGGLLDRLDQLKLALLSGEDDRGALDYLGRVMREAREEADDPDLSALLDQIDLRAAVELAKAELRSAA